MDNAPETTTEELIAAARGLMKAAAEHGDPQEFQASVSFTMAISMLSISESIMAIKTTLASIEEILAGWSSQNPTTGDITGLRVKAAVQ